MSTGDRVQSYINGLFAAEDSALAAVRQSHLSESLPQIHVSAEEGKIIHMLVTAVGARRVLDVGTLGGYSAIWIARALPEDGQLVTVELDPERASVARRAFQESGVSEKIELVVGDARDILPRLEPHFDVVFLDADKESLPAYFDHSMGLLRVGGLLLCDNTHLGGRVVDADSSDPDVVGMREFNRLVARDKRLVASVIPVRDGLMTAVKISDRGSVA